MNEQSTVFFKELVSDFFDIKCVFQLVQSWILTIIHHNGIKSTLGSMAFFVYTYQERPAARE